ncbi:carcinine transporter-like [Choristoneura fumiferana]|uniref:carcinine transporter-like n=1 Tax=Choristoneura fumiferana TaxID=7141 RepID=UPI003D15A750
MEETENHERTKLNIGKNIDDADDEVPYDDLLTSAGDFGLYQMILFISSFPFYLFAVFSYFDQMFITEVSPNHWCNIPELQNLSEIQRRRLAIPLEANSKFGYSRCSAYVANWTEVLASGRTVPDPTWPIEPCRFGWEFNISEIPYRTIASELGWVCDKDSYQATAQSIFFVGSIAGGFVMGWISDRFGRLPGAAASNVMGAIGGIASIFAKDFAQFAVCRFFMGMSWDNSMMMTYLLMLEYVAPKYRTLLANLPFALFYTTGVCSLPWIALACNDWRLLSLVTCIPMSFAIFAPYLMPESAMWLISVGRAEEAIKQVQRIAQVNKKEVTPQLIEQFRAGLLKQTVRPKSSIVDVLKRPVLRKMFICLCLAYMCCNIAFDALVRSLGQLNFDLFTSFSIVSITEFFSLSTVSLVLDLTGRKWLSVVTFVIVCVFSVLTTLLGGGVGSVICAVLARYSVNMNINIGWQWGAEMFPTGVRATAMSIIHTCGYVATVISPMIVYLEIYYSWLPLVIVGCLAGFGALVILGLPETAGKEMPQTFNDAETLFKNAKFFEVPFLMKKQTNLEVRRKKLLRE